jgi:hypothetical protein
MTQDFPKPNQERARYAVILMYAIVACHALGAIASLFNRNLDFDSKYYNLITAGIGLLAIIQLIIYVLTIIFFIMWFRRAYNNLHLMGSRHLEFSEGWAAGSWFVPFVNLGRPYKIMKDIWNETQLLGRNPSEGFQAEDGGIVGWWWAMWIIGNIISNISFRMQMGSIPVDSSTSNIASLLSDLSSVAAGLLVIRIIRKISPWEDELMGRYNSYISLKNQQDYMNAQAAAGNQPGNYPPQG